MWQLINSNRTYQCCLGSLGLRGCLWFRGSLQDLAARSHLVALGLLEFLVLQQDQVDLEVQYHQEVRTHRAHQEILSVHWVQAGQ